MNLNHPILYGSAKQQLQTVLQKHHYSKIVLFCDTNTVKHCLPLLQLGTLPIISMPAGENNKTIQTCERLWNQLLKLGADRNSLLINVGGGVVTDLGGFAASCYKRGVDFINIPTSLLAMVDASSGGKTGVNFGHIKNSIGAFAIPKMVIIDESFLATLPTRHLHNGIAEILKHGFIADREHINELNQAVKNNKWLPVIEKSVSIKQTIVARDPYEKGLRKTLNFGHTIGHAIESYSLENDKNPLLHGEAIALGMIVEAFLSTTYCGLSENAYQEINRLLLAHFQLKSFSSQACETMLSMMKNDKKNKGDSIRMSLLNDIGQATFDIEVSESDCLQGMQILIK